MDVELKNGKRDNVISHLLSIDAGHGRICLDAKNNVQWNIDCAIQPWKHTMPLFFPRYHQLDSTQFFLVCEGLWTETSGMCTNVH